jgi:hypothetical protein
LAATSFGAAILLSQYWGHSSYTILYFGLIALSNPNHQADISYTGTTIIHSRVIPDLIGDLTVAIQIKIPTFAAGK